VRRQPDDQVQVAGRGALAALPALAGQPDPLPVDHPGRDVHLVAAPVEGDPPTAAPVRLLHRQDQLGLLVGAGHRPPAAPGPAAEHAAQQVFQVDVVAAGAVELGAARWTTPGGATRPRAGAGPGPGPVLRVDVRRHLPEVRPERVVAAPGVRVGQDVVRLRDLLEPVLGARILVHVRVVGTGELAVGALDLLLRGGSRHPEGLVEIVASGH